MDKFPRIPILYAACILFLAMTYSCESTKTDEDEVKAPKVDELKQNKRFKVLIEMEVVGYQAPSISVQERGDITISVPSNGRGQVKTFAIAQEDPAELPAEKPDPKAAAPDPK